MREDIELAGQGHLTLGQFVVQQLRELIPVPSPPPSRVPAHEPLRFALDGLRSAHASPSVLANPPESSYLDTRR